MKDVINDDMVLLHLQYSTQWDTLAHVGQMFDADGDGIPIEDRNPREVTHVGATRLAPEGAKVRNPAFDVTPQLRARTVANLSRNRIPKWPLARLRRRPGVHV